MKRVLKKTVVEVAVLLAVGSLLGLTVNALRADGVALGRNYFAKTKVRPAVPAATTQRGGADETRAERPGRDSAAEVDPARPTTDQPDPASKEEGGRPESRAEPKESPGISAEPSESAKVADSFVPSREPLSITPVLDEETGLYKLSFEDTREVFRHWSTQHGLNVFVDARDAQAYNEGHIPGALLVDHYRLEDYLPQARPAIESAQRVIVYCSGGECEDSFFLATSLWESGIEPSRIFIYKGGWDEWIGHGMPDEEGGE